VPAGCDTVYDIGSLTKQFTAAAIVKLEMRHQLDVHDPISRWIGPVPPDKAAITVQQLLTHTSGLVDALGDDYERLTRRRLVRQAMASPLRTTPGTAYHYSNLGYSLLALIVESASGTTYERFLARELFRPAGMRQTGYVLPHWRRSDVAVEYDARGVAQGRPFDHPWAATGPWWNLRGNGGLLSTAADLARWQRALLDHRVLDRRAQRELFRPRVPEEPGGETWYGYGWVLLDTPLGRVAWHNGGNGWSYAEIARVLGTGAMVFWVTNRVRNTATGWNLERIGPRLTAGVARRLVAKGRP
jgi:CubicO group peptidase (beta-lactamase class C family)